MSERRADCRVTTTAVIRLRRQPKSEASPVSRVLGAVRGNHIVSSVRKEKIDLGDYEVETGQNATTDGAICSEADEDSISLFSGAAENLRASISSSSLRDMLTATERIMSTSSETVSKVSEPALTIPASDSKDEAAVACGWLRAAGFPQYAQLYEDGRFPTDFSEIDIEQDHKFLNDYEIEALMRRLKVLQRYAGMRIDDGKDEESDDEEEGRAISNKWKYRRRSGKWQRRHRGGSSGGTPSNVGRHQSLRSQAIGRSIVLRKTSSDSRNSETEPLPSPACSALITAATAPLKIIVEGTFLSPPGSSSMSGNESVSESSYVVEKEEKTPRHGRLGTPSSVVNFSSTTDEGELTNDSDADSGACSDGEGAADMSFSARRVTAKRGSNADDDAAQWTQVLPADPSSHDSEHHLYGSVQTTKSVVARRRRFRWHSFQRHHRDVILPKSVTHIPMSELSVGKLAVLRKIALLKLTSMIERYANISADGHYSIGSVQRYLRKHLSRQPDYTDKHVFGVPLHVILQRTGQPLPQTILYAMRYLRRTSLDAVGLFRRTGSKAKVQKLKEINEENPDNVRYDDSSPYEVADMLKEYFRDLPERLLTNKLSESLILIVAFVPRELRLQAMQAVMLLLPDENREALQSLLLFLRDVAERSDKNKMTAENLAVCFAPSLLSLPGQAARHSWDGKKKSVRVKSGAPMRSPKEAASESTNHANDCLTLMIQECQTLLMIPRDYLINCRFTHLEEGDPVPYRELGVDSNGEGDYTTFTDSCIQGLLKESADKFRGWRGSTTVDGTEISYKKVGDGHPLRLWRGTTEVPASPSEILNRLLRERHLWDMDITRWRVVETLDEQTEIFQFSVHSMAPHPTRDYAVLRSWRSSLPNDACALVETSVLHPAVTKQPGSLQGTILAARYLIEAAGPESSRLTFISRIDTRGRSADYYNNGLGPYVAALVGRVRDSFKTLENGMETEV